jgi:hypothetical protein
MQANVVGGWARPLAAVLLTLLATVAAAAEPRYDYAKIESVEPIVTTRPAARTRCEPRPEVPLGDLHGLSPGLGLVATLRQEAVRSPAPRVCAAASVAEVTGYRVRYRYGGEIWEQTLPDHPGERLRVRVSVRPGRR